MEEAKSIPEFMIGIAGLGLIGGSLAMAFHKAGFRVTGFDKEPDVIQKALGTHVLCEGSVSPEPILNADIIFIALYPDSILHFLKDNAPFIKKGSIVVDCCGIKEYICPEAEKIAEVNDFFFIGGHPMAGTERSGFEAARADLYQNASFILTPPQRVPEKRIGELTAVIRKAGFKRVVLTDYQNHDRMIAFTSQLPHVLACAYVKSPCCPGHKGYSAGSFRDVSRVAHINAPLWSELFIDNKKALVEEIDHLIENMREIRNTVESGDEEKLTRLLAQAREIKDRVDP